MNNSYSSITEYTIGEISADAGRQKITKDFHVMKINEISYYDKILHPYRSNHFSVFLVTEGESSIQSNLIKYVLQKNSLFIVPPGIVHQFQNKNDACKGILLQFTTDFLLSAELHKKHVDAFTFFSRQNNPHLQLTNKEAQVLVALLLYLREKDLAGEEHPFGREIIRHSFSLFMYEMAALFTRYRENEIIRLTRKEEMAMSFMQLLTLHFKEERSVQFYADHLYVSPKHLSKTIKEIIGKTTGAVIDEMVITEAKILLDDPSMSVGKVADELHFSDQFFFSKFFKSHTGLNPSEYKRSLLPFQN